MNEKLSNLVYHEVEASGSVPHKCPALVLRSSYGLSSR